MSVTSRIAGSIGKHHSFWAMYSLRMSVWIVPAELLGRDALLLGRDHVEGEHDRGRRVDRHRGRDLAHGDAVEERLHVVERVDRHALAPDLALASAGGRSRGPSATACRTPSTGRSGRGRAGSGSARWSPRPCRSRRTGASSRAGRGTSTGRRRACTGYSPGKPIALGIGQVLGACRAARPARREIVVKSASRSGVRAYFSRNQRSASVIGARVAATPISVSADPAPAERGCGRARLAQVSAAVQAKSRAPSPRPESGRKYSRIPPPSTAWSSGGAARAASGARRGPRAPSAQSQVTLAHTGPRQ